ncbi:MAG: glycosyltransferase, partial [Eubacteriales bacterium]|nr:glycosyltransferase [Eubacteriales bacterium]
SLFFDFTHKMFNDKKKILYDFNFIIITPSQWLLDRVKQSFLSSKKIIVIHNGVDTNIFKIKRNNSLIENLQIINKKIVLTAAPDILSDSKGGQYVVNIAKRKMNENIIFIILGVKGIKDIQKKGNIIYSPLINNKVELSNYYNIADLFVICSKKETFSMTCAESLSCGTRVVGYKSGAPETIFNNKYASFVEYGNENLLNELINQKININYDRETIRKYAMDHFSLIQMTKQYDKIYGIGEQKEFG